jgi:hypothetical protein
VSLLFPNLREQVAKRHAAQLRASGIAPVCKADEGKRIVYGVVLDPYAVDLQGDWSPPDEVENAAHGWLANWRMVGSQHAARSPGSQVVESYVFPYPTPEDYRLACAIQPHRVYELQFGADVVHSGSWVIGVKLVDDAEWNRYLAGEYGGFSIRGFGDRVEVPTRLMPAIEVLRIDSLVTAPAAVGAA